MPSLGHEGGVNGSSVGDGGSNEETLLEATGGGSDSAGIGGAGGAGGFATIVCADETRAIPYRAGIEVTSELGLHVALLQSRPTPRVGNLTWTLQVLDGDGEPVLGATVKVSPFMPDHHHGSPLIPAVAEQGQGVYVAKPINLTMPGYWHTTVRVTTDTWSDIAVIPLCIE